MPELSKHCRVYALDVLGEGLPACAGAWGCQLAPAAPPDDRCAAQHSLLASPLLLVHPCSTPLHPRSHAGFGWSDKPVTEYDGYELWRDQIAAFLQQVVGVAEGGEGAVLVGNSLGGYNALATAAYHPQLVRGVVLLNAAGRFEEGVEAAAAAGAAAPVATVEQQSLWSGLVQQGGCGVSGCVVGAYARGVAGRVVPKWPSPPDALSPCGWVRGRARVSQLRSACAPCATTTTATVHLPSCPPAPPACVRAAGAAIKRAVVFASFVVTKQPARIRQVLGQVGGCGRVGGAGAGGRGQVGCAGPRQRQQLGRPPHPLAHTSPVPRTHTHSGYPPHTHTHHHLQQRTPHPLPPNPPPSHPPPTHRCT